MSNNNVIEMKKMLEYQKKAKARMEETETIITLPKKCGNCIHYFGSDCRINPPVAMLIDGEVQGVFPPMYESEYCSKHEYHPDDLRNAPRFLSNNVLYIGEIPRE